MLELMAVAGVVFFFVALGITAHCANLFIEARIIRHGAIWLIPVIVIWIAFAFYLALLIHASQSLDTSVSLPFCIPVTPTP